MEVLVKNRPISRRDSIKKICKISGGILAASSLPLSLTAKLANAEPTPDQWIIDGLGQQPGFSVRELTRKVFEKAGGIGRFIAKGDVVVIKPNVSWAREPALAATQPIRKCCGQWSNYARKPGRGKCALLTIPFMMRNAAFRSQGSAGWPKKPVPTWFIPDLP